MSRSDPVRSRFFIPVERAEKWSDWLFYAGVPLSIATLFVHWESYPVGHTVLFILFAVDVLALFIVGTAIKLYFGPRAMEERARDFLSTAYGIRLTPELTDGYYNNAAQGPLRRVAAQLLENLLFTKTIVQRMLPVERTKAAFSIAIWVVWLLLRGTELDFIVAISQAIFSEQILSKYLRMEWLRIRCEHIYDVTYKLFQANPKGSQFAVQTLEAFNAYETAKATAAITLSERVFHQLNDEVRAQWRLVKTALNIPDNEVEREAPADYP
jgi:hypothetical protein